MMRKLSCLLFLLIMQNIIFAQLSFKEAKRAKSTFLDFGLKLDLPFPYVHKSIPSGNVNQLRMGDFYTDKSNTFLKSNPFTQPFTYSNSTIGIYTKLYSILNRERMGVAYVLDASYGNRLWEIRSEEKSIVSSSKIVTANLGLSYSFRRVDKSSNFGIELTGGADYNLNSKFYSSEGEDTPTMFHEIMMNPKVNDILPKANVGLFWEFAPGGSRVFNDGNLFMNSEYKYSIGVNYTHYFKSIIDNEFIDNPGFLYITFKTTLATPFKLN